MASEVYAAKLLFLIMAALILSSWQQTEAQKIICINSTEQYQLQENYQCDNFTSLLNASATIFASNTTIFFLHGSHFATASLTVSNITNLVLRGPEVSPDKPPVAHIVIEGERFYFKYVSNMTLKYITITSKQCNALQFHNIYSMVIGNMHIVGSCGYGLYAYNILGNFSIANSKFLNNSEFRPFTC